MDAEELVVEHPLRLNFVVSRVSHDLPFQFPGAGHMIDQSVIPLFQVLGAGESAAAQPDQDYDQSKET
jgi:hypothetical protein